ncbi:MAG TPA: acyl-CoA dehydrogenase [Syntrophomonas sp.]|jgi:alkylation response protein AidB-like acyl-CoA dehydrogenase|nr:acyl-CoA dehydrogenase [Syntrophomonas sp.]
MNFDLTQDQEMVIKMARDVVADVIAPRASEVDEKGEFPVENIKTLSELGLMGLTIPEEYGGTKMDNLTYAMVVEEIAKGCAATASIMSIHSSTTCVALLKFGTEEQKRKYLPGLANGKICAFALTEADSGSDAGSIKTSAVLDGDSYVLNGTKCFISNSGAADVYTIFAKTDKNNGTKGISAFIVEAGTPGLEIGKHENKMGIRGSLTCELIIDNLRIPKENLLGEEGKGFKIALATLDSARVGVGAQAVGIAQAAYETALAYAKERKQFGNPIIEFEGISFMLADMAMQIESARLLVHKAACASDAGKPFGKEAAMCKCLASDMAVQVCLNAIQILGGYGYMKEYPTERYLRDAKITQIYEGTNQIQRVVISNYLKK